MIRTSSANSPPKPLSNRDRKPPVHTYNNGQPYQIARGRLADRSRLEQSIHKGHSILQGRPTRDEFLAAVKRELKIRKYAQASISNYMSSLNGFLSWLGSPPNTVTSEHVRNYLEILVDGGASSSHLAVTLSAIRNAFDKFCCRDVTLGLATPRKQKRQPIVLSTTEVTRIINSAPTRMSKLAIGIMYAAGLRNRELCRLRVRDLDFDRNTIRISQGKGAADRLVMLPKTFSARLFDMCSDLQGDDWIFPSRVSRRSRHISSRTLQRWVHLAADMAGIKRHVTPHSFRHAFATHLLENGTDIRFIQKLLGHQRLETTTIYTRVAQINTTSVVSPLDRISTSEAEAETVPSKTTLKPVGSLCIVLSNHESQTSADISLVVLGADRSQQAILDGITVRLDSRNWVQLELPPLKAWQSQLGNLSVNQQSRIGSPEFFENIRHQISSRFLASINLPPD